MEKVLKLYKYVDENTTVTFPDKDDFKEGIVTEKKLEQAVIYSFKYTANRMGSSPTITAKLSYKYCLDDVWSKDVYAEFNGEKYYIRNTPSSSKSNTDERYEHEIELLSERDVLNQVYFIDAVQGDSDTDVYKSNSTKILFFGDIVEFVARLNASFSYLGLTYSAVIDSGVTSEAKQVSIEDKYISEALQEIFNIYELPYYFVGKVIHIGFTTNAIPTIFRYGHDDALLSISKNNANYKVYNQITGIGSSDNIPYYYPNESDDRSAIEASGKKWITPTQNLMPSIYRTSEGAKQFYDAINNTYEIPGGESGDYYVFENVYSKDNPQQGKVSFDDIKPSITGVTNGAGENIDTFLDFAYDTNDNDEVDDEGNYLHPYFFAKLKKTNGADGFNLFEQAIEQQPMQISMTSGVCGACVFEIGVGENTNKNTVQVDDQGNLLRDENGDVRCGREGKPEEVPQDRQNDTKNYEVWLALKKDNTTYPQLMPNKSLNYRPSTSDKFVILGINLPLGYITAAEKRLDESLIKHMWMNNREKFTFSIKFSRIYFEENKDVLNLLNENARVTIEYNGISHTLYVDNYSYSMDGNSPLPEIDIDLVDTLTIGKNSLQQQLDSVKQDILSSIGGGDFLKQGLKYFIRKDVADTAMKVITFMEGIRLGSKYIKDIINSVGEIGDFETDNSVMSVKRMLSTFIRKDAEDSTNYLLSMLGGAIFGEYLTGQSGGKIDENGAAELLNIIIRESLKSNNFSTGALGSGLFLGMDENGDSYLEVDRMLVRKLATFVELLIQQLRYSGGQIILTPAAMKCSKVEEFEDYYRCYFETTDGERTIAQEFVVGDQARCQTFNVKEGINENVSNAYYWRLVVGTGDNYIDLSKTDCDTGSTVPEAGQDIVLLGNRNDPTRQTAIILSSYGNDAPYIKMYKGINSYQLSGKEFINFSHSQIMIIADELYFSTGESVSTVINGVKADLEETKTEFQGKIDTVDSKVDGIQIGVRNLLLKSNVEISNQETNMGSYVYSEPLSKGKEYTLTLCYTLGTNATSIGACLVPGDVNMSFTTKGEKIVEQKSYTIPEDAGVLSGCMFYQYGATDSKIHWAVLVEGNKAPNMWVAAPEDLTAAIEEAQDAADAASQAASDAQADATEAKSDLANINSDNIVSPPEKPALRQQQADIQAEYQEIIADASRYGISTSAYTSAYNLANTALTKYTATSPTYITVGSDYANIAAYYDARQTILNSIAAAAKQVADETKDKLDNLQIGGRNLIRNSKLDDLTGWNKDSNPSVINIVDFDGYKCLKVESGSNGVYATRYGNLVNSPYSGEMTTSIDVYATKPLILSIGIEDIGNRISKIDTINQWVRLSTTQNCDGEPHAFIIYCYQNQEHDGIYFKNVKLEVGNVATAWSPAPEDMEEQLQTVSGTVTTLSSELTNTKEAFESYKGEVESKFTAAATATEEQIENAVVNLQKGMRNLVQQGLYNIVGSTEYLVKIMNLTKSLVIGNKYTVVLKATVRGEQSLYVVDGRGSYTQIKFYPNDLVNGIFVGSFEYAPGSIVTNHSQLFIYNYPSSGSSANPMDLEWVCLYEGNIKDTAPDYFVNAPEDLNLEINSVKQSVSAIEHTAENISLRVTTTETKVTTAQNTADDAQTAADNAQSSADSALDAANDALNASNSGKLYVSGTGYNIGGLRKVILNNNGVNIAMPTVRGMNLITLNRSDLSVGYNLNYDYTTSRVNSLIERLNSLTDNVIVILASYDSFETRGDTLPNLLEATSRCGGSGNAAAFAGRVPYALVGIPGIGKGAGIEVFTSSLATAPAAEISTQIINGIPVGISTQAKNMLEEAKDYTADRTLPTWRGWIDVTQDADGNPLDENKYYPLTIRLYTTEYTNIRLKVILNSGTKPSWATHIGGFTVHCEWNAIGSGWGSNSGPLREIIEYSRAFTNTETLKIDNEDVTRTIEPAASIGQITQLNYEYIYLRGGGKYYFEIQGITYNSSRTEFAAQDIQLHTTTFVPSSSDPDYKIEVLTPEDITIIERTNVTKTEYTAGINNLATEVQLYATKKLTLNDGTQEISDDGNLTVGYDVINGYVGHYNPSTKKWTKSGFMVKDSYAGIFSGKANSKDSAIVEVLSSVEVYGDTAAISASHVVITGETKFVTKGGNGSVVNIFSDKAFSYISGSTHQEVFNINNGVFAVSDYGDVHIGKYYSGGTGILYNYNTSTLSLRGSINITSGSININNGVFKVTNTGAMTATNANITGTVTATSGKIGGFEIDGSSIYFKSSGYENSFVRLGSRSGSSSNHAGVIEVGGGGAVGSFGIKVYGSSMSGAAFYASNKSSPSTFPTGSGMRAVFIDGDVEMRNGMVLVDKLYINKLYADWSLSGSTVTGTVGASGTFTFVTLQGEKKLQFKNGLLIGSGGF